MGRAGGGHRTAEGDEISEALEKEGSNRHRDAEDEGGGKESRGGGKQVEEEGSNALAPSG
eukprot:scaffold143307_cov32-Tisochrysis_lutea.AAC.4